VRGEGHSGEIIILYNINMRRVLSLSPGIFWITALGGGTVAASQRAVAGGDYDYFEKGTIKL